MPYNIMDNHVKTRSWNAILALGHKNEKKLSTTEYGAFFEYGRGNYTTFNGDERGEIGATFRPGEKSNVTLDLNLSGFAGKKQGLTGGLSAVFHI